MAALWTPQKKNPFIYCLMHCPFLCSNGGAERFTGGGRQRFGGSADVLFSASRGELRYLTNYGARDRGSAGRGSNNVSDGLRAASQLTAASGLVMGGRRDDADRAAPPLNLSRPNKSPRISGRGKEKRAANPAIRLFSGRRCRGERPHRVELQRP